VIALSQPVHDSPAALAPSPFDPVAVDLRAICRVENNVAAPIARAARCAMPARVAPHAGSLTTRRDPTRD